MNVSLVTIPVLNVLDQSIIVLNVENLLLYLMVVVLVILDTMKVNMIINVKLVFQDMVNIVKLVKLVDVPLVTSHYLN